MMYSGEWVGGASASCAGTKMQHIAFHHRPLEGNEETVGECKHVRCSGRRRRSQSEISRAIVTNREPEYKCNSLIARNGGARFHSRLVKIISSNYREATVRNHLLPHLDVRAFQPDHKWDAQTNLLVRGNDTFSNRVALHDASKYVDQNAVHIRIR